MEDNGIQVSHYWEILLPYIKKRRRRLECILEYWIGIESIDIHLNSLLKEPRNSDIPVAMGISSTLTLLSKYWPLLKGSRAFSSNYWLASLIVQLVKNLPAMQETRVDCWVGKIPWRPVRLPTPVFLGFPCSTAGKESAGNLGDLGSIPGLTRSPREGRPGFDPWVGKIPWRREKLPTPVFWPGEFHGLYSPWGRKESDSTGWFSLSFTFTDFSGAW